MTLVPPPPLPHAFLFHSPLPPFPFVWRLKKGEICLCALPACGGLSCGVTMRVCGRCVFHVVSFWTLGFTFAFCVCFPPCCLCLSLYGLCLVISPCSSVFVHLFTLPGFRTRMVYLKHGVYARYTILAWNSRVGLLARLTVLVCVSSSVLVRL